MLKQKSEGDLPIVHAIGLVQTRGGWTVVELRTQGTAVIGQEILEGNLSRVAAHNAVRVAVARYLLAPPGDK